MNTTSRSQHHQTATWLPGFLERMACCAMPPNSIQDMVVMGDSLDEGDHDFGVDDDDSLLLLEPNKRIPLSAPQQQQQQHTQPTSLLSVRPPLSGADIAANLRSPTLSPSRRDLERWNASMNPSSTACCAPASLVGSTATTASLMSEDDEVYGRYLDSQRDAEETRSNATTQIVSHRKRKGRNTLLSSTLASAELRLKEQLREEEARAQLLQEQRQPRQTR